MERDQFINEILNSADHIKKVRPSAGLYSKIESRIYNYKVSARTMWMAAASIAILLTINILLITKAEKQQNNATASFEQTLNASNELY
ncbi:hypothetical protein [Flavobacterium pedocola]